LVGAVGLGLCAAIAVGDAGLFGRTALAGFAYVPAVWVLTAIAVALFGVLPRWTALAWAPLGVCVVIGLFGTLLSLPTAVLDVSPFEHTPSVPAASWSVLPPLVLVLAAAAITAGGLAAFRRRDVPA
jgi:ABC-2 type transport system permease protein